MLLLEKIRRVRLFMLVKGVRTIIVLRLVPMMMTGMMTGLLTVFLVPIIPPTTRSRIRIATLIRFRRLLTTLILRLVSLVLLSLLRHRHVVLWHTSLHHHQLLRVHHVPHLILLLLLVTLLPLLALLPTFALAFLDRVDFVSAKERTTVSKHRPRQETE